MFSQPLKRTFLLPVAVMAFAPQVTPTFANPVIFRSTVKSTGWIVTPNTIGTCWVVDTKRRWVITCAHVTKHCKQAKVYFPLYDHGKVITSRDVYTKTKPIPGRVLAFNRTRDLALIELAYLPKDIKALPLARKSPARNEPVYAIGNSNANSGSLWKCRSGKVLKVGVMPHTASGEKLNGRWIKSSIRATKGDSGGPQVNRRGALVGMSADSNPANSNAVDVTEVRAFLQRQRALADRRATAASTTNGKR